MTDTPIEDSIKALHYARSRNKEAQGTNGECPDKAALAQQGGHQPVVWKHSCNVLCVDGLELWIDACPHWGKPRSTGAAPAVQPDNSDLLTIAFMDGHAKGKAAALANHINARVP